MQCINREDLHVFTVSGYFQFCVSQRELCLFPLWL